MRAMLWCSIRAVAIVFAIFQSEPGARSEEPVPKGLHVYTCGHSFHFFIADIVADVAKGAGIKDHDRAGVNFIGGSRIIQHWNMPDDRNKAKELLKEGKLDVLTLSPIMLPDDGLDKFVRLALEHNPKVRITVQQNWLPYDQYKPANPLQGRVVDNNSQTGESLRKLHEPYFKTVDEHVRDLNKTMGKEAVFVVPVGQAMILLREKIIAGEAPGIKEQKDLFSDALGHVKAPAMALNAYCHYAVIYQRSPVGLPRPAVLTSAKVDDKLNRLLQELAWEAVTKNSLSGVKAEAKP